MSSDFADTVEDYHPAKANQQMNPAHRLKRKGPGTIEQFPCKPERNTKDEKNQKQIRRPQ
jgi:hypothetical protein